jgi:hypothetical protein
LALSGKRGLLPFLTQLGSVEIKILSLFFNPILHLKIQREGGGTKKAKPTFSVVKPIVERGRKDWKRGQQERRPSVLEIGRGDHLGYDFVTRGKIGRGDHLGYNFVTRGKIGRGGRRCEIKLNYQRRVQTGSMIILIVINHHSSCSTG